MVDPRAYTTPIPTPPVVRLLSSALFGIGVAILTTALPRGVQVVAMAVCLGAGVLIIFSHPYRRQIREFLEERNLHYTPKFTQILPLFLVWLALMIAPAFAPAPLGVTLAFGVGVFLWMFWVFPHIDGSRALAFLNNADGT